MSSVRGRADRSLPPESRADLRSRAAYSEGAGIFRILPDVVAKPSTTDRLIQTVRWAAEQRLPIVPRGAGSGMSGGNVGRGLLIDCSGLDGAPLAVDRGSATAWTGAAVTIDQLNAAARPANLRMPVVPSSSRWATVGGVLATNAAGPLSHRYGSVREWVRSLDMLTGTGERISLRRGEPPIASSEFLARWEVVRQELHAAGTAIAKSFPRTRKNSAGYALDRFLATDDLIDLVIGSEGTLGIVVEATWLLQAKPEAIGTARLELDRLEDLSEALDWIERFDPAAVELLDRTFLEFVADPEEKALTGEAVLLIDLEGDPDTVLAALRSLEAEGQSVHGRVTVAWNPDAAARLWEVRHAASPRLARLGDSRRSLQVIEDGAVPRDRLGDYVRTVRETSLRHRVPAVLFGHAGDGHLHVNLIPDVTMSGWDTAVQAIFDEVASVVADLGGTPSGEHGDGRLRAGILPRYYPPEILHLFRSVKRLFDPESMMNPEVILGETSPWSMLKVGARRIPIPEDIAQMLRSIEQDGRYDRSRLDLVDRPG